MKRIYLILASVALLTASCADFLNMPPKNTKVVYTMEDVRGAMSTLLFATTNSTAEYINSSYVMFNGYVVQYPFTRSVNVTFDMLTNDMDMVKFYNPDLPNPLRGGAGFEKKYFESINWESYALSSQLWETAFTNVGYINMLLKDLEGVPDYNKTDHDRITGEARVMRAYYLLRMNQVYAPYDQNDYGIPFNFDADVIQGGDRWKQTDLYRRLIGEITDVLEYETVPKASWNIFFNKKVMYAILAQTYMYKAGSCAAEADDWSKAEYYAKLARDGNRIENTVEEQRELTTVPLNTVVNKPHAFALLRIALYSSGPNDYAPWGKPEQDLRQSPSEELYSMYDANDIRREVYFKEIDGKPYFTKLIATNEHDINDTHVLFRYSDLLLIEAEALARQGKSGALELLNEFKGSKIPGYAGFTGDNDAIIKEILKERRKEFILEEETNWIDMKRNHVAVSRQAKDAAGKVNTYTLESNDYRYALPLPADKELQYNNIPQNPGWK